MRYLTYIFLFVYSTVAIYSNEIPSIPLNIEIPSVTDGANAVVIEEFAGYPFLSDRYSRYGFGSEARIRDEILQFASDKNLLGDNAEKTLRSIFFEANAKIAEKDIDRMCNVGILNTEYPSVNAEKLLAAFVVSKQSGVIVDITPYLQFSRIFFGNPAKLFDHYGFVTSYEEPTDILTAEQRLAYFPAANAIIHNKEKTLPLLKKSLLNKGLDMKLRLRAAAFINSIDKNALSEKLIQSLDNEI